MIVRFDDVSMRSDMVNLVELTDIALEHANEVWWAISPLTHSDAEGGRVFPRIFGALSDHREFYRPDSVGIPAVPEGVRVCSHGLIHVDHRLLSREEQEMSLLVSCSLVGANVFVPPFNKWDAYTEDVCDEHEIELVKFEDGWLSAEHHERGCEQDAGLWYLHARRFACEKFAAWIGA